ncbi:MAG: hypothetical protein JW940_06835 [Polyangiaceae bacterium]|nr:hypothetical protein [Polyangiaceae bacterium]
MRLAPQRCYSAAFNVGSLDRFLAELKAEFPHFRLVPKSGDVLSRVVDIALRALTLGGQRHYMTRYHTVIGQTLYVPQLWSALSDVDKLVLLRHERVHLRQSRRLGSLVMGLAYLLPFFPLGLAWCRARLEWEAYCETLRATAELKGIEAARDPELRAHVVRCFVGPDYGWMWPFASQVERWYDEALLTIERSLGHGSTSTGVALGRAAVQRTTSPPEAK